MKLRGDKLDFISWIKRDGSGTVEVPEDFLQIAHREFYELTCLSMTEGTYIASGFNSFVVKLKQKPKESDKKLTPIQELVKELKNLKDKKCVTSTDECVLCNVLGIIENGKYLQKEKDVIEQAYLDALEENVGLGEGMGVAVDIKEAEDYYYTKFNIKNGK